MTTVDRLDNITRLTLLRAADPVGRDQASKEHRFGGTAIKVYQQTVDNSRHLWTTNA
jgi:hypothetical protein